MITGGTGVSQCRKSRGNVRRILCGAGKRFVMNDVMAVEDSDVIFFDVKKILTVCSSACRFHTAVVENLVYAISERNRSLVQKLGYMSKRTTREN